MAALPPPVVRWDTSMAVLVEESWDASMAMLVVEGVPSVGARACDSATKKRRRKRRCPWAVFILGPPPEHLIYWHAYTCREI